MGVIVISCGLLAAILATRAGYGHARSALTRLVHDGEPTRAAIEATRPIVARTSVRLFVRHVGLAVGWLVVALYGLWLATEGAGL